MLLNILMLRFVLTKVAQPEPRSSFSILLHVSKLKAEAEPLLMQWRRTVAKAESTGSTKKNVMAPALVCAACSATSVNCSALSSAQVGDNNNNNNNN